MNRAGLAGRAGGIACRLRPLLVTGKEIGGAAGMLSGTGAWDRGRLSGMPVAAVGEGGTKVRSRNMPANAGHGQGV